MSPPVEIPASTGATFFDEAQVTQLEETELRRKFKTVAVDGRVDEASFTRLVLKYGCCSEKDAARFFRAFDRAGEGALGFDDFCCGCVAADPACTHVLNSFTGFERLRFTFDFYSLQKADQAGLLSFSDFTRLVADCLSRPRGQLQPEAQRKLAAEKATELGVLNYRDGEMQFQCLSFKALYMFVKSEQLRGTSRLFRFRKGLAWPRKSRAERSAHKLAREGKDDADELTDDDVALDQLLDMGMKLALLPDEHAGGFAAPARRLSSERPEGRDAKGTPPVA